MSSSNQVTWKGTSRQLFICLSPPTLFTFIYPYLYIFIEGREGGGSVEPERRGEAQEITRLGRKYQHDLMYARNWLSPVYKLCVLNDDEWIGLILPLWDWQNMYTDSWLKGNSIKPPYSYPKGHPCC
jgi:hypothetical protein